MTARYTVFVDDGPWRVVRVVDGRAHGVEIGCAENASILERAEAIAVLLHDSAVGRRVVLTLPSDWCLSAVIDVSELSRTNRRQAMHYLLEEHLPLSAEDAVMDFSQRHSRALGVCAELDRLRPIVEALRDTGVQAVHLCPAALLAGAYLVDQHPDTALICLSTPSGIDLIHLDQQSPTRWRWFSNAAALADDSTDLHTDPDEASAGTCVLFGKAADLPQFAWIPATTERGDENQLDDIAALQAARYLDGEASPWVDLGRDALAASGRFEAAQKNMTGLAAALALFLLCAGVMTYWRGERYAEQAEQLQAQQVSIYKEVMPGQRVPTSIHSRLKSEQRRLAGLGGNADTNATAQDALHPTSALTHLYTTLSVWPTGDRCRLSDITIEPGLIRLNGETASSVIPEQFAADLRETGVYEVTSPNISALSEYGFSFGFLARPIKSGEGELLATETRR